MSSGKNHDRITLFCLPWIIGIATVLTRSSQLICLLAGGFLFSGLMFGPDLDIYSIQYKRWGLLRWLWLPYQKFLPHRSLFSHGLLIGTAIRIIYLLTGIFMIAAFATAIFQLLWGFEWNWQEFVFSCFRLVVKVYPQEAFVVLLGLELGAMSHSLTDWISSELKILRGRAKPKARGSGGGAKRCGTKLPRRRKTQGSAHQQKRPRAKVVKRRK